MAPTTRQKPRPRSPVLYSVSKLCTSSSVSSVTVDTWVAYQLNKLSHSHHKKSSKDFENLINVIETINATKSVEVVPHYTTNRCSMPELCVESMSSTSSTCSMECSLSEDKEEAHLSLTSSLFMLSPPSLSLSTSSLPPPLAVVDPSPISYLALSFVHLITYCHQYKLSRCACPYLRKPILLLETLDRISTDDLKTAVPKIEDIRKSLFSILFGNMKMTRTMVPWWNTICRWAQHIQHVESATMYLRRGLDAYQTAKNKCSLPTPGALEKKKEPTLWY
ncbi:hypothetical protein BDF14DRAFT_286022 [Spinellus fusiger]|nr:hypothetical protein BDF14DRAFT_286022 [Spinellus fusiger]